MKVNAKLKDSRWNLGTESNPNFSYGDENISI